MPIANFVDRRKNKYNVEIDAIFEPSCQDNSIGGATKFEISGDFYYEYLYDTTICQAILAMADKPFPVTLFAYDKGSRPGG